MEHDSLSKTILRKMLLDRRIGGRHLGLEDLSRGFPSHEKGNIPKAIKKLIKEELIQNHPTSYGVQYSLNPQTINEVLKIIEN